MSKKIEELKEAYLELSQEELEEIAGGDCSITVNGVHKTVVSSGLKCFVYKYSKPCYEEITQNPPVPSLANLWMVFSHEGCCGYCKNLRFDSGGSGYCALENEITYP